MVTMVHVMYIHVTPHSLTSDMWGDRGDDSSDEEDAVELKPTEIGEMKDLVKKMTPEVSIHSV